MRNKRVMNIRGREVFFLFFFFSHLSIFIAACDFCCFFTCNLAIGVYRGEKPFFSVAPVRERLWMTSHRASFLSISQPQSFATTLRRTRDGTQRNVAFFFRLPRSPTKRRLIMQINAARAFVRLFCGSLLAV